MKEYNPLGFHIGPGGRRDGLFESLQRQSLAGLPIVLKSVDDYGMIHRLLNEIAGIKEKRNAIVFRLSSGGFDLPDYNKSPRDAAAEHSLRIIENLPTEFDKDNVWLEVINEPDKNRAEWLAEFMTEMFYIMSPRGYKLLAFGWSAGEPETNHWQGPKMLDFLRLASSTDRLGIALHEYSLSPDGKNAYPYLIGRFQFLLEACDKNSIGRPQIFITEWGWMYDDIGDTPLEDIRWAAKLVYHVPEVKMAALWYLGGGANWGGIADKAIKLLEPIEKLSLSYPGFTESPPNTKFSRTYVVLPQDMPTLEAKEIFAEHWKDNKQTVGGSYHDAGLNDPNWINERNVIVYDRKDQDVVREWYVQNFPGVNLEFRYTKTYPDEPLKGLKLGAPFYKEFAITSHYGDAREYDPVFGHEGTDYDALWEPDDSKLPVLSLYDGVIYAVLETSKAYGNYTITKHEYNGYTFYIWYCHMDRNYLKEGKLVKRGDFVGELGATGGNWGEHVHINIQIPGYGDEGRVIPDVIDPEPYISLQPAPQPAFNYAKFGVHMSADPGFAPGEIDLILRAKPEILKVLTHHDKDDVSELKMKAGEVDWVVRAFLSFGDRFVSPQDFVKWTINDVVKIAGALQTYNFILEVHNEPNLRQEGLYYTWSNGFQFSQWFEDVLRLYKEILPSSVKYAYPGLSPGGDYGDIKYDHINFWNESHNAIALADYLCIHAYWSDVYPMQNALEDVRNASILFPTEKIIISETSHNKKTLANKGAQYVTFVNELKKIKNIIGATFFVSSASYSGFESEIWITRTGQSTGIVEEIENLR